MRSTSAVTLGLAILAMGAGRARSDTAVTTFAGNPQHTAVYTPAAQDLNTIRWSTPIDLNTGGVPAHYGAPLLTAANTIVVPVKTATDGFRLNVFDAADGTAKYSLTTDYILPTRSWIPAYQPALAISSSGTRLYYAGAGGTVYFIADPDFLQHGAPVRQVFYTSLANYLANAAAFNARVFVNTPLTADSQGNVFFGFRVQGTAPSPLNTTQSGFVRLDPNGHTTYVLVGAAAGDANIGRDSHNSAPALSNDQSTLYVVVKPATGSQTYGYLLGLDATTLATKYKVFLKDPRNHHANNATLLDDSTASPMVAPDGDVYFGIFANPDNGSRGFLLRFSGDLTVEKTPGGFGWDITPALVPAAMVPSYTGASPYLIFTKYNDYANVGADSGAGVNRIALLDPNTTEVDPHPSSNGLLLMREVLTVIGPTSDPESRSARLPYAVREWCINTAAVNPATHSVFTPSEDGHVYRWDLAENSLSQLVALTAGIGEPYVPTVIGPDGTVFTENGGTLFALGSVDGVGIRLASSRPDVQSGVAGASITFTATIANPDSTTGARPTGTVTFADTVTFEDTVHAASSTGTFTSATTVLAANVPLDATGQARYTSSTLSADVHFVTALYSGDAHFNAGRAALVQRIHAQASVATLAATPNPANLGQAVTFTANVSAIAGRPPGVGTPTGMVTFADGTAVLAQMPLGPGGTAAFSTAALAPGTHAVTVAYASDPLFASSRGSVAETIQRLATTTKLKSSPNPSASGHAVSFTATVATPGTVIPPGTVTFREQAKVLGTASLNAAGQATWTLSTLSPRLHSITAEYAGSGTCLASVSAPLVQAVTP